MNRDGISVLFALVAHAGLGVFLTLMPPPPPAGPKTVEFEVRKKEPEPEPPKLTPPEPPKPPEPEPEKKVIPKVKNLPKPEAPPPPNQTPPKEPPKQPVQPVFGVTMDSVVDGDAAMAVPVGNTTMIDPKKSRIATGPVEPLQAAPPPAKPSYQPVSDLYVKTLPEIDSEACGNSVKYPEEAARAGIEGVVTLRIELDETGKVHSIRVLKGLGHGLDEYAEQVMRKRPECRFKPAVATDGKAVPYVIRNYAFRFELPR